MRAVRVKKRGGMRLFSAHWLRENDEGRTVCGRLVADMDSFETVELSMLPPLEACLACERALDGYTTAAPTGGRRRVVLQPSLGYFSPYHGRGRRLHR